MVVEEILFVRGWLAGILAVCTYMQTIYLIMKKIMKAGIMKGYCITLLTGLLGLGASKAAVLASYNFTSGATTSAGHVTGSLPQSFAVFSGADEGTTGVDIDISSATGTAFLRSDATGTSQTNALSDDDYFSFTVNADSGKTLNLSTLTFRLGSTTQSNGNQAFNSTVHIQTSVGGIGSTDPVFATATHFQAGNGPAAGVYNAPSPSIDLSGSQFQNLSTITFRFSFSDDGTNANSISRLDDMVLNGSIGVVPEPSATLLGAIGLAVLLRRRR